MLLIPRNDSATRNNNVLGTALGFRDTEHIGTFVDVVGTAKENVDLFQSRPSIKRAAKRS